MYKRQILFCCLAQLTIVMSATTSSSGILTDTTPKSTVSGQCLYNGQVYDEGDSFKAINDCNMCYCVQSQTICALLPCQIQQSESTTVSSILPDTTSTSSSTESGSGILPDTTPITTEAGNCFYNGQMYNVGDIFKSIDDCNTCSCGWLGTTCTLTFCPPKHSATTSSSSISSDFTSTSATSTTSTIISSEATYTTTTPMQCVYNGQVYNVGDTFIANDHCSICWCLSSQMICTMCPPQPSTSATSSTISPDTTTTTTAGQCVYNGQVYNDGDIFIANDYCQSYCWCMGSQMICTMCPPQTSASTTSSTIYPDTTTTRTRATSSTISPDISTITNTKKKRRRTTLPPALYTQTKKFHTDLFNTITKKPHFTVHNSHELGSKRSTISKGNRRNVEIR